MRQPLLIFDFDGTIANSIEQGILVGNLFSETFGYEKLTDFEEVRKQSAVQFIFSRIKWYQLPYWAYLMKREMGKRTHLIGLYSGIPEELEKLSNVARLGIISGGKPEYIRSILARNNCLDYFEFIYGNQGTKKHKLLKKLIKKEASSEHMVHIGDDTEDLNASQKAGIKHFSVCWGATSKSLLEKKYPDACLTHPDQLTSAVQNILQRSKQRF